MADTSLDALSSILKLFSGTKQTQSSSGGTVVESPSTSTKQTNISSDLLSQLVQRSLEQNGGLADVVRGQQQAGLYNSSTNSLLANDLLSRIVTQQAAAAAPSVTTNSSGIKTTSGGTVTTKTPGVLGGKNTGYAALAGTLFNNLTKKANSASSGYNALDKILSIFDSPLAEGGAMAAGQSPGAYLLGSGLGQEGGIVGSSLGTSTAGESSLDFLSSLLSSSPADSAGMLSAFSSPDLGAVGNFSSAGGLIENSGATDVAGEYLLGSGLGTEGGVAGSTLTSATASEAAIDSGILGGEAAAGTSALGVAGGLALPMIVGKVLGTVLGFGSGNATPENYYGGMNAISLSSGGAPVDFSLSDFLLAGASDPGRYEQMLAALGKPFEGNQDAGAG